MYKQCILHWKSSSKFVPIPLSIDWSSHGRWIITALMNTVGERAIAVIVWLITNCNTSHESSLSRRGQYERWFQLRIFSDWRMFVSISYHAEILVASINIALIRSKRLLDTLISYFSSLRAATWPANRLSFWQHFSPSPTRKRRSTFSQHRRRFLFSGTFQPFTTPMFSEHFVSIDYSLSTVPSHF